MSLMLQDATFASLRREIEEARDALTAVLRADPERDWHPSALKASARNGWSADVMNLALESLIDDGTLVAADGLRLSLVA